MLRGSQMKAQGTYSGIVTNERTDYVVFGIFTADGNGNWSGSAKFNQPAPFGLRKVIDVTFTGTYTVNVDGMITLTNTFTRSDGYEADAEIDGVTREAEIIDGIKIITELIGFSRGGAIPLLMPGSITKYHATRLPD